MRGSVTDPAVLKKIRSRIRGLLSEKGMSQKDLVEKTGLSKSLISRLLKEDDAKSLTCYSAQQIALAFEVPVEFILCETDSPSPSQDLAFDCLFRMIVEDATAEGNSFYNLLPLYAPDSYEIPADAIPDQYYYFSLKGEGIVRLPRTEAKRMIIELINIARVLLHQETLAHGNVLSKKESEAIQAASKLLESQANKCIVLNGALASFWNKQKLP